MAGDYERAVEAHKDRVFTFAYYFLGSREEAEDATQEVLIRLWRHWPRLDPDIVPAWLTTVTRNICHDLTRRRRRYRARVGELADDAAAERAVAPGPGPEAAAEASDFDRQLRQALARLPEPYRSAVILREIGEHKYLEISAALELPLNTVKTYIHRGRRQLREQLRGVLRHVRT